MSYSDPSSEKRAAEIEEALRNYIEAFNDLHWERFQQCFSPETSVFNPAIPEVTNLQRLDDQNEIATAFKVVFDATRKQKPGPHICIKCRNRVMMLSTCTLPNTALCRMLRDMHLSSQRGDTAQLKLPSPSNQGRVAGVMRVRLASPE